MLVTHENCIWMSLGFYFIFGVANLENTEGLLASCSVNGCLVCNDIEPDSFAKWTALSNSYNISFLDVECRGAVNGDIPVPLLETPVFDDVMKVVSPDYNSVLHLSWDNQSLQNSSANRDISSEWAFLINVIALNCRIRGLDSKSNWTDVTHRLLALVADCSLASNENCILALVGLLVLYNK